MSDVNLTFKHGRTQDEARKRLGEAVSEIQARFGTMFRQVDWSADRNSVHVLGHGFEVRAWVDAGAAPARRLPAAGPVTWRATQVGVATNRLPCLPEGTRRGLRAHSLCDPSIVGPLKPLSRTASGSPSTSRLFSKSRASMRAKHSELMRFVSALRASISAI